MFWFTGSVVSDEKRNLLIATASRIFNEQAFSIKPTLNFLCNSDMKWVLYIQ
jgi:hypothetical protein